MKTCIKCQIPKELTEFHKRKNNTDGRRAECKECRKEVTNRGEDITPKQIKASGKIDCLRGGGQVIYRKTCIPGCNDACIPCENKQLQNIKAGSDTYTAEEERIIRHDGVKGAGYHAMIEMYADH